jgi:hypothetical protein
MKLAQLRKEQALVGMEGLHARYPGVFLAAMGVLSAEAEEVQLDRLSAVDREPTRAFGFGDHLRVESTPLSTDTAIYLPPSAEPQEWRIGRSVRCEIRVADDSVSEFHGTLSLRQGSLSIADCGSTNGTRVNFELVRPRVATAIALSDMLTLGRYTFWLLGVAEIVTVIQVPTE